MPNVGEGEGKECHVVVSLNGTTSVKYTAPYTVRVGVTVSKNETVWDDHVKARVWATHESRINTR